MAAPTIACIGAARRQERSYDAQTWNERTKSKGALRLTIFCAASIRH
jgi:hypothetical protein